MNLARFLFAFVALNIGSAWAQTSCENPLKATQTLLDNLYDDTWEPTAGLTIDLGLKYDHATMRNDIAHAPPRRRAGGETAAAPPRDR